MKLIVLTLVGIAAVGCQEGKAPQVTASVQSGTVYSTTPPHVASTVGMEPWHAPIEIANGDLADLATGEVIHFVEPGLVYNGRLSGTLGHAGYGMALGIDDGLTISGNNVKRTLPTGETVVYQSDGGGGFISPPKTFTTLTHPDAQTYVIRIPGGTRLTYRAPNGVKWVLSSITDRNLNTNNIYYDGQDRPTSAVDAVGRTTSFAYGTNGLLRSVTDPENIAWTFDYDAQLNLVHVTKPNTGVQTLSYDSLGLHLLLKHLSAMNVVLADFSFYADRSLAGYKDAAGALTVIAYYPGQVRLATAYKQVMTLNFTSNGELSQFKDDTALSRFQLVYSSDGRHLVTQIIDELGQSEYLGYDANNNLTSYRDRNGDLTTATYNSNHDLLSVTTPTQKRSLATYDANDQVTAVTNELNQQIQITRDPFGNALAVRDVDGTTIETAQFGSHGEPTTVTTNGTDAWNLGYDSFLNLSSVRSPSGHTYSGTASPLGRPLSVTSPLSERTTFGYDAANRLIQILFPNNRFWSFVYDLDDRLIRWTSNFGGLFKRVANAATGGTAQNSEISCVYDDKDNTLQENHNGVPLNALSCTDSTPFQDPSIPPQEIDTTSETSAPGF